jgi:hypothetical protein
MRHLSPTQVPHKESQPIRPTQLLSGSALRFQQVLNRSRREFGESGVSRSEDSEWSSSLHRVDQACGTESGRQRLKLTSRNRGVDDVLRTRSHIISPFANFERVMAIDPVVVLLSDRLGRTAYQLADHAIAVVEAIRVPP